MAEDGEFSDLEAALVAALKHAEAFGEFDIAASLRIILEHVRRKPAARGDRLPPAS